MVDLHWPCMILMGCLLTLLSFMQLAIPLFCFPLQCFVSCGMLLSGVCLHHLSFPVLSLAKLSFSVHVCLVRGLYLGLLESLRDSRKIVGLPLRRTLLIWGSLG